MSGACPFGDEMKFNANARSQSETNNISRAKYFKFSFLDKTTTEELPGLERKMFLAH